MSCHGHMEYDCPYRQHSLSDRSFDVDEFRYNRLTDIETTRGREWWTLLSCTDDECDAHYEEMDAHLDSIVIAVDGACRGNGTASARAAAGIFFHRDNYQWNQALKLPDDCRTSQRAELSAALEALKLAMRLRKLNTDFTGRHRREGPMRRLRRVVIKADSAYLVNAMTDWIYKWRKNGFLNARGFTVVNADLFDEIDDAIEDLNELDVEVQFWHVPRQFNFEADHLANEALDGRTALEAFD